jgi:hypothetical protein
VTTTFADDWMGSQHGLWTPGEEIAFTERPKIKSQSQIYRYGRSKFCLPHRPKISDIFELCLHWVSVVRGSKQASKQANEQSSSRYWVKSLLLKPALTDKGVPFQYFCLV